MEVLHTWGPIVIHQFFHVEGERRNHVLLDVTIQPQTAQERYYVGFVSGKVNGTEVFSTFRTLAQTVALCGSPTNGSRYSKRSGTRLMNRINKLVNELVRRMRAGAFLVTKKTRALEGHMRVGDRQKRQLSRWEKDSEVKRATCTGPEDFLIRTFSISFPETANGSGVQDTCSRNGTERAGEQVQKQRKCEE